MSEQEFESYLRLLARFLRLNGGQRETIARELRAHMEDRLEDLLARGYSREDAVRTALDEFGDAAALAGEFGRIGRRRRWIMRTTTATFGIAAAVLLVSFLLPEHRGWLPAPTPTQAGQGDETRPGEHLSPFTATAHDAGPDAQAAAEQRVLDRLQQVIPTVDLAEGTSFVDAVEFLRQQTKINVTVNWAALALIGVERTTDTGGLSLREAKTETVLEVLLDNITQAGGAGRVAYEIMDGTLRISTVEDLNTRVLVRIYDCRDLLGFSLTPAQKQALEIFAARLAREPHPATRPGRTAQTQPAGANHGPRVHISEPDPNVDPLIVELLGELRNRDADYLVDVITSAVEPGSWAPEGSLGDVEEFDGMLVIRHTWSAQRQVSDLLAMIRRVKSERAKASELPLPRQ